MPAIWKTYALSLPSGSANFGSGAVLNRINHVSHTKAALRILDDGRIARTLICDESVLNATRTTVVWMSPNVWHYGSRYGNIQFTFDFSDLIAGRRVYWVEAISKYNPPAFRFILSDKDLSHLPVTAYDSAKEKGPLQFHDGVWWWNAEFTAEFMLDDDLSLDRCRAVEFVKHHDHYCALGARNCSELGSAGHKAMARLLAYILARDISCVDDALTVTEPKAALSMSAESGFSYLALGLGVGSNKLKGPLKEKGNVDAVLRAALIHFALGDKKQAKITAGLIGSDSLLLRRLAKLARIRFGYEAETLRG